LIVLLNPFAIHGGLKYRAAWANHIGQQFVALPAIKYGKIATAHLEPNQFFSR
jgi:hypothetical protein